MYELLKRITLPLLRIEDRQPDPPVADAGHGSVETLRASPGYLSYRLLFWKVYACVWSVGILLLCTVLFLLSPLYALVSLPIVILGFAKTALLYVTTRLDYEFRWYVITDRSLLIRQGVWLVREITLTFVNAQNVRVTQGPLQRFFGISNVEIDTAGGGGMSGGKEKGLTVPHRAVLRGLEEPEKVRALIVAHLRAEPSAGVGDPDDVHEQVSPVRGDILEQILEELQTLRTSLS